MRLKIAALADYATISQEKKLSILGMFTEIYTEQVPCARSQIVVVVQFEFEPHEAGQTKRIGIELLDEERPILSIDGQGHIPPSRNAEPVVVNQVMTLYNIVFPRFGQYEFKVLLDGEPVTTLSLRVIRRSSESGQIGV